MPVGQGDRFGRTEPTVDLEAEVHLVADRFAIAPHRVDGVLDLVGVAS